MQKLPNGCRCFDETTLSCPVHGTRAEKDQPPCVCFDPDYTMCPQHSVVERFEKLTTQPKPLMTENEHWEEVTVADHVKENGLVFVDMYDVPTIFIVRGPQMFKLKWPPLPSEPKKVKP